MLSLMRTLQLYLQPITQLSLLIQLISKYLILSTKLINFILHLLLPLKILIFISLIHLLSFPQLSKQLLNILILHLNRSPQIIPLMIILWSINITHIVWHFLNYLSINYNYLYHFITFINAQGQYTNNVNKSNLHIRLFVNNIPLMIPSRTSTSILFNT